MFSVTYSTSLSSGRGRGVNPETIPRYEQPYYYEEDEEEEEDVCSKCRYLWPMLPSSRDAIMRNFFHPGTPRDKEIEKRLAEAIRLCGICEHEMEVRGLYRTVCEYYEEGEDDGGQGMD